jgi:hypothetical protein
MITTNSTIEETSPSAILELMTGQSDRQSLLQYLRLARLKLGSAIERLETYEACPDAVPLLSEQCEYVAFQVDSILETIHRATG